ncbi:MAG: TetR/AcrR family transcriptional regulator [Saprospiraceae bacterium]
MKSKRQQIKEHAARLFRKQGYKATNMRQLAEAVGVKAASLYNHISNKEELLQELLMDMAQLFTQSMAEVHSSSLNPVQKLERLITDYVRYTVEHTDAISLLTGEWVHLADDPKKEFLNLRDNYEDGFRQILTDCMEAGHFKSIDVDIALFSTLSTLRWLYSWYSKHKDFDQQELEKQIKTMLIEGLRKQPISIF